MKMRSGMGEGVSKASASGCRPLGSLAALTDTARHSSLLSPNLPLKLENSGISITRFANGRKTCPHLIHNNPISSNRR